MRVAFSRLALRDLDGIADYIEPRNPAGAARVAKEIERTIQFIAENPKASAEILQRRGIRRAIVTRYPYLIYYRPEANRISVLRIVHAARRQPWTR